MLTPKNIKAKTAAKYFKQGYYQKGKWLGKGARSLGLKGEIKNDVVYENIVNGLTPDGSKRLNRREVQQDRRKAAVDCTFAAPKSVSLCALVGNDERLILAHERAVEKVLEQMESEYAQSRVMLGGNQQEVVKTQNMVIAKYDHIESRELDPHLHSHCLVMNMTQLPNGEWYSHLNDDIFRNQKLLGMKYQHYLALEVQKLGYEIEQRSHGQFDIKGYSESDLDDFSKRRMQILGLTGVNASWTEREKAWKKTRRNKENVLPEELKALWREEAAALGLEIVKPGVPIPSQDCAGVDEKIFADAIKYCSERRVAFRAEDIQAFILSESRPIDIATVEPLINTSDELIRIEQKNGCRYTTITAVERELATINLMKAGIRRENAIATRAVVEQHLASSELNFGQRQAVMMTLTSSNSFVAWQGVAGAGKTFALKQVKEIAQAQGYTVKSFAPSAKASKVLGEEIQTQTQTVARLLAYKPPDQVEPNQLWIVDEAGLLSAKDAYRLFQKATQESARVILVGDTRQLSAIESGNPFKSLQQAGIETAYLNESQRQKNAPALKLAIDLLAEGRVKDGFARLNEIGSIQKVSESTKTALIVKAYFQAPPEERAKTLVLAGTNKERLELTAALRRAMQTEGSLGSDVTLTQLKAKDLREVQLGYTSHFAVGDMVMPLRNYKRKGLDKGELYEVIGRTTDTIELRASDGRQLDVSLDFKKAVYQREEINIAVGDRLMWKKNNYDLRLVNGAEVTVSAINGNVVEVVDKEGLKQIVDLDKPQHLDHAIVRTTYSSQGESAERVLVAADSTMGKESFYVAASRARYDLRFYTCDENKLLEWALSSRAQENPLELIENQVKQLEVLVEPALQVEQRAAVPTSTIAPPIEHNKRVAPPVERTSTVTPPVKRNKSVDEQNLIQTRDRGQVEQTQPQPSLVPIQPSTRPIPKEKTPNEPFFSPQKAPAEPSHIDEKHWRELVEGSAIDPILAAPNIRSLRM
ncbi:MAG TPA: MobF family relaxase, partial [Leptolyngbyaceae cyanobacterium]